jgi:hypothetical protein
LAAGYLELEVRRIWGAGGKRIKEETEDAQVVDSAVKENGPKP